jgi:hypothetical protein
MKVFGSIVTDMAIARESRPAWRRGNHWEFLGVDPALRCASDARLGHLSSRELQREIETKPSAGCAAGFLSVTTTMVGK